VNGANHPYVPMTYSMNIYLDEGRGKDGGYGIAYVCPKITMLRKPSLVALTADGYNPYFQYAANGVSLVPPTTGYASWTPHGGNGSAAGPLNRQNYSFCDGHVDYKVQSIGASSWRMWPNYANSEK
jgi:prepilin-type processing-associated H-X9-DG protein